MPAKSLVEPDQCVLALIDHQPQMLFGVQSHDRTLIINNVVGLARAAKAFGVPTILTTVGAKTFSGPLFPELEAIYPGADVIDRTTMNAWEDARFIGAVKETGRRKLVIASLWTEVCLAFPALSAREEGYDVYAISDASGGTSVEAHELAMRRMEQAGIVPMTWMQLMYEWQRDWARAETADAVRRITKEHGGAFGQGIAYASAMWGAKEAAEARESGRGAPKAR